MIAPSPALATRRVRVGLSRSAVLIVCMVAIGAGVGAAAYLTASRTPAPSPALPQLHGTVTWAAGARPAPVFTVRTGAGVQRSSTLLGRTVVVAFQPATCTTLCATMRTILAATAKRLPAALRPAIVVVGGRGTARAVDPAGVRAAFGVAGSKPLLYLVDRSGDERAGFLVPFAPAFVEDDLRALATEGR